MTLLDPIHFQGIFQQSWSSYSVPRFHNLTRPLAVKQGLWVVMAFAQGHVQGKAISEKERRMGALAWETQDLRNSSHALSGDILAKPNRLFYASPFKYLSMHQVFGSGLKGWCCCIICHDIAVNAVISKHEGRFKVFIVQLLIHCPGPNSIGPTEDHEDSSFCPCIFFSAPTYLKRGHWPPQALLVTPQLISFNCRIRSYKKA